MAPRPTAVPYAVAARIRAVGPVRVRARVAFGASDLATASLAAFAGGWLIGWFSRLG
ncbi:MAG: hypothetical protein ACJ77B_12150 [Chloroflexota bacterium]